MKGPYWGNYRGILPMSAFRGHPAGRHPANVTRTDPKRLRFDAVENLLRANHHRVDDVMHPGVDLQIPSPGTAGGNPLGYTPVIPRYARTTAF